MRVYSELKIAVAGTGYVGLSIAILLARHHEVTAVDIVPEKVEELNKRISPIQDAGIEEYLQTKKLNLKATLDGAAAYADADKERPQTVWRRGSFKRCEYGGP